MKYYQIRSAHERISSEDVTTFLKEIYAMNEKKMMFQIDQVLRFHIIKEMNKKVKIVMGVKIKDHMFEELLFRYYPEGVIEEIDVPGYLDVGRTLKANNKLYPIKTHKLLETVILDIPEGVVFTLDITREKGRTIERMHMEEKRLHGIQDKSSFYKLQKKALEERLKSGSYTFDVDMYINATDERFERNIPNFIKKIRFATEDTFNKTKVKGFSRGLEPTDSISFQRKSGIVLLEKELAPVLQVPTADTFPELLYSSTNRLRPENFQSGIKVGEYIGEDGKKYDLRIPLEVLTKHMFVSAVTGGGKSALLIRFFESLIVDEKMMIGATVIDPNLDTIKLMINRMLYLETQGIPINWNKVHFIDANDGKYLPSMNLFNIPTGEKNIDIIQSYIQARIKDVYSGVETPTVDDNIRNLVGTLLLEKDRENTMLDASDLLLNEERQWKAIKNIGTSFHTQTYRDFWANPPSKNDKFSTRRRLNLFQSPQMKRMFGLPEFDLPIKKWMDEGHFVFINTMGLSPERQRLIIGHLFSQYDMIVKSRAIGHRRPHFMIIDEGKQIQLPIIWDSFIPEARKFGLHLIHCTQMVSVLNKELAQNIKGQVRTQISGKQQDDAAIVSRMMNDTVDYNQLQQMKDLHLVVYTEDKNGERLTAEIEVPPPYIYYLDTEHKPQIAKKDSIESGTGIVWAEKKLEELQKRDWRSIKEIDELLEKRYNQDHPMFEDAGDDVESIEEHIQSGTYVPPILEITDFDGLGDEI